MTWKRNREIENREGAVSCSGIQFFMTRDHSFCTATVTLWRTH
jgi:hypothetical protein